MILQWLVYAWMMRFFTLHFNDIPVKSLYWIKFPWRECAFILNLEQVIKGLYEYGHCTTNQILLTVCQFNQPIIIKSKFNQETSSDLTNISLSCFIQHICWKKSSGINIWKSHLPFPWNQPNIHCAWWLHIEDCYLLKITHGDNDFYHLKIDMCVNNFCISCR